jgi:hypothetical protein
MVPRSTLETDMYLDDIIDHVKVYFAGNDSKTATLKVKDIEGVRLPLNHAMAGFSAYSVSADAIHSGGSGFKRGYIVLEYPNGEVETLEVGCLMKRQEVRKAVDAICDGFLAAA